MPMYEYRCAACGWEGTRITTIAERDTQTCMRNLGTEQELQDFLHGANSLVDEDNHDPRCRGALNRTEIPTGVTTWVDKRWYRGVRKTDGSIIKTKETKTFGP